MFGLFASVEKKNEKYLAQIKERLKSYEQGLLELGIDPPYYKAICARAYAGDYSRTGKVTGLFKKNRDFIDFIEQQAARANLDYKKAAEIKPIYD